MRDERRDGEWGSQGVSRRLIRAEACLQAGLDDFGNDSFREGLEVYCESVLPKRSSTSSATPRCGPPSSRRW